MSKNKSEIMWELCDKYVLIAPGMWENDVSNILTEWWAVCNDEGIIAYFSREKDGECFRDGLIMKEYEKITQDEKGFQD